MFSINLDKTLAFLKKADFWWKKWRFSEKKSARSVKLTLVINTFHTWHCTCRCRILSGPIYEQNVKYLIKKRGLDIFSKNPYNSKIFGFKNQKISKYSDFLKKSQQKKQRSGFFCIEIFSKNPYNSEIFGFKNQKFSNYRDFLKKYLGGVFLSDI